jgi:hypothetical protein
VIDYESPNTIDVLFVGSSHIYTNVNPITLWSEQGIASFNYSGSGQTIWNSYYYIVEALKRQKPSIVMLDILQVGSKFENDFTDYPRQIAYSTFSPSLNKFNMINAGVEPENRLQWNIDLMFYHTRWKNITADTLLRTRENYFAESFFRYKGFATQGMETTVQPAELNTALYPVSDETTELAEKNLLYLMKIIELSKTRGFKLVLIKTPTAAFHLTPISNTVKAIAEENNIDFVDFHYNHHRDSMGLDYLTDYYDLNHLTMLGSEKFSSYLAKYIKDNYDVTDRRGDPTYKSWDETADNYLHYRAKEMSIYSADLPSYLEAIKDFNRDLIFITSVKDDASERMGPINNSLSPIGVTTDFSGKFRYSYISVYEPSSGYLYEEISPDKLEKVILKNELPINIEVASAGQSSGDFASIIINGVEYSKNQRGLNIAVYDKVTKAVIDYFSVDTCGDETYTVNR